MKSLARWGTWGRIAPWVVVTVLSVTSAGSAPAQSITGTITNGNASFTQTQTPTASSGATAANFRANFTTDTGGLDHMHGQWMFYRVGATGQERAFGNHASGGVTTALTGTFSGNTATYTVTDTLAAATRFTATWTQTLVDGPSAGSARLGSSLTVNNPNVTPLTVSLFHYLDFDLNAAPAGDAATGGLTGFSQIKGTTQVVYTPLTAANAYQAGLFPGLQNALTDTAVTNLNNTGLPAGAGDVTVAYQWNLTIAGNSSATINSGMALNPVPEPAFGLLVAVAGLAMFAVRPRRRLLVA